MYSKLNEKPKETIHLYSIALSKIRLNSDLKNVMKSTPLVYLDFLLIQFCYLSTKKHNEKCYFGLPLILSLLLLLLLLLLFWVLKSYKIDMHDCRQWLKRNSNCVLMRTGHCVVLSPQLNFAGL